MLKALGLDPRSVEAVAWLLVQRWLACAKHASLLQAMSDLFQERRRDELTGEPDLKLLYRDLDQVLDESDLALSPDFFNHPKEIGVLESVKPVYGQWLQTCGISSQDARAIALLPYMPYSLFNLS